MGLPYIQRLTTALRDYDGLTQPRMLTTGLTQLEAASVSGDYFRILLDGTLANNEEAWFKLTTPAPETGKVVAIVYRDIMPDLAGFEYEVYNGTTGVTDGVIYVPRSTNYLNLKVPEFGYVAVSTPIEANRGEQVDKIRIGAGSGPATQRDAANGQIDSGFVFYGQGVDAFLRLRNTSGSSNGFTVRLGFVEVDSKVIVP